MNQIEKLRDDLARRFPELAMTIDSPIKVTASHWLDIRRPGLTPIVVEWRPDRGFGVSVLSEDDSEDFGDGADEVYPNARAAFDRVVELIETGGSTKPPGPVALADLRRGLGLSQVEVAERAGIGQSSLAQLEARADSKVSTLARVVEAMGAKLSLHVDFPGGRSKVLDLGTGKASADQA